jgi:lysozyme family protein
MKKKSKVTYSNKFNKAFESLMLLEGGYSNESLDSGKETKYGICKRSYPHLNIKDINIDQAKEIYYRDYWSANSYDKIKSHKIAEKVFHGTVHAGPRQSHMILQRALHSVGHRELAEDGVLGDMTLDAVNKSRPGYLIPALRSEMAGFYRLLIANRPSQGKFRNGWLKRAYK